MILNVFLPRFIDVLRRGDRGLETDLAAACHLKDEGWVPRDNACSLVLHH